MLSRIVSESCLHQVYCTNDARGRFLPSWLHVLPLKRHSSTSARTLKRSHVHRYSLPYIYIYSHCRANQPSTPPHRYLGAARHDGGMLQKKKKKKKRSRQALAFRGPCGMFSGMCGHFKVQMLQVTDCLERKTLFGTSAAGTLTLTSYRRFDAFEIWRGERGGAVQLLPISHTTSTLQQHSSRAGPCCDLCNFSFRPRSDDG